MRVKSIFAALLLTACSAGNVQQTPAETAPTVTAEQTVSSTVQEETAETTAAEVPNEPVDITEGLTDAMYSRALISKGNMARLAKAMKKSADGESITIGVIGGSITQGSCASTYNNCYANLFYEYWAQKFPSSEVSFVNAGIGGTNSYLGVHRADEQLLEYKPDVVIVEFSVNDTDRLMNKYSYDSLVRKILSCDNEPAVILLFTTQENGTSLWETHKEIGDAYDLPMLSYREAVFPEVSAGTVNWKDISPDNIHPNDIGHMLIGQIISRYLDSVYDDLDNIDTSDTAFTTKAYTADYYRDAKMYSAKEIEPQEISGFEIGTNSVYPQLFPDNFVTEGEGRLVFETDCSCLGFFFLKQTDGNGGKYDVYVDGKRKGVLDADFSGGWGTYGETQQVLIGKEKAHHVIEVKLSEGSEKTALTILGIMQS